MSPFFVKHFKVSNPCPTCTVAKVQSRAPGKSLCPSHLAMARLAWRLWAIERREVGRCINCSKKSVKNNCRCKGHREENRVKCMKWSQANPSRMAANDKKRRQFLETGLCLCREHNPLPPGQRRCATCKVYGNAFKKGDKATLELIRAERRQRRFAKDNALAEQTRAQLASMGYRHTSGTTSVRQLQA